MVPIRQGGLSKKEFCAGCLTVPKKGCSLDNSACEGVFGRIKNEMFYNTDWTGVSISEFITILDKYLYWYNEVKIKNH